MLCVYVLLQHLWGNIKIGRVSSGRLLCLNFMMLCSSFLDVALLLQQRLMADFLWLSNLTGNEPGRMWRLQPGWAPLQRDGTHSLCWLSILCHCTVTRLRTESIRSIYSIQWWNADDKITLNIAMLPCLQGVSSKHLRRPIKQATSSGSAQTAGGRKLPPSCTRRKWQKAPLPSYLNDSPSKVFLALA